MRFCPKCEADSTVSDSRLRTDGNIRRRRSCDKCGEKWSTIEISLEEFDKVLRMRAILANMRREMAIGEEARA